MKLSTIYAYKIAVAVLAVACGLLAVILIDQTHSGDRARQACEERNHQHQLQSALSGGAYTWPEEDCH